MCRCARLTCLPLGLPQARFSSAELWQKQLAELGENRWEGAGEEGPFNAPFYAQGR